MKVINDNLGNPNLNVEMIATEVGISRVHLHRKLKELTNQSTRDLIRNVRLKQAASLLANQYHNITEVLLLQVLLILHIFLPLLKNYTEYRPPPIWKNSKSLHYLTMLNHKAKKPTES